MMQKRILCVFSLLDRGGAENMCMNIYRNIDRERVQFDFVKHGKKKCELESEIIELGGKIYSAPEYRVYNHIQYINWWKKFFLNHPEYRVVHGHYYTLAALYLSVAKQLDRITIAHSHNTHIDGFIKNKLIKNIGKYADYCFACGQEAGEWLFPDNKFMIINNGIDVEKFKYNIEIREKKKVELNLQNAFIIGEIANFSAAKNPLKTVEIVDAARKKNDKIKMIWAGEGSMRKVIEEKITEKKLQDTIYLLGNRNDVNELVQAMDVLVLPSVYEGLPVSLIEAQASGLPCLCSNNITKEVNVTGLCKFLNLDDIDSWIEQIININTEDRYDTSNIIIENGYDARQNGKRMEEFYCSLY